MKHLIFPLLLLAALASCDKVERPYEVQVSSSVDSLLFPNEWSTYPWPLFSPNTNVNRNILVEDYTGHTCVFCPAAADIAHELQTLNPGRIFVASIHASPGGLGDFQALDPPTFVHDFTNPQGLQYGITFQNGYGFVGNPRGTINRLTFSGSLFQKVTQWEQKSDEILLANDLQVNLQAKANYYPETRGLFLHTQIDPMTSDPSKINLIAYFIQDSLIAPQKRQENGVTETVMDYVHRDVHRGNLDGSAFGRTLTENYRLTDGLYQVDMSFKIPEAYNPENCHVLVYAMNRETYEIYQVIKVAIP